MHADFLVCPTISPSSKGQIKVNNLLTIRNGAYLDVKSDSEGGRLVLV